MEVGGEAASDLRGALRHGEGADWTDLAGVMRELFAAAPAGEAAAGEIMGEIDAPQRAVLHACLGERAVEVEQSDQTGPFAAPVGDRENGAAMGVEPM